MKYMESIAKFLLIACILLSVASCKKEKESIGETRIQSLVEIESTNHVILINPFKVPKGKLDKSIKYWEACRDFLKDQPGYVSTKLHMSLLEDVEYELVNIAVWENPKAYFEAIQKLKKEPELMPVKGLLPNACLYTVIRE